MFYVIVSKIEGNSVVGMWIYIHWILFSLRHTGRCCEEAPLSDTPLHPMRQARDARPTFQYQPSYHFPFKGNSVTPVPRVEGPNTSCMIIGVCAPSWSLFHRLTLAWP